MNQKQEKLIKLRSRIIDEVYKKRWKEVWFYPEFNGVKGWKGTGGIMFIGLNPATANFGGFHDLLYYTSLKKYGFKDAHLTDIFKTREINKKVAHLVTDKELLRQSKIYLSEEIKILKPKLIVLLGKSVEEIYKIILPDLNISVKRIGHYSYRYKPKDELERRWLKQMKIIKDWITET